MKYLRVILIVTVLVIVLLSTGCFGQTTQSSTAVPSPTTGQNIKPVPSVKFSASTAGTEKNYYTILDISVKNSGADGTVILTASVIQSGITQSETMSVYLNRNETQEIKMVFPLVWKGGDWTPGVQCEVP